MTDMTAKLEVIFQN